MSWLPCRIVPATFSGVALCAMFTAGCHRSGPPLIKAKMLALSPAEYSGKRFRLEGRVIESGPMGAYFVLEDDTGKTFVSGASVKERIRCGGGEALAVEGEPKQFEGHVYFDVDRVVSCSR